MNLGLPSIAFLAVLAPPVPVELVSAEPAEDVKIVRLPRGSKHPTAVIDGKGTQHVVYFQPVKKHVRGGGMRGDILYVKRKKGSTKWSKPVTVNQKEQGAGFARLAIGKSGRVHVAWMRMNPFKYWYTRSDPSGKKFYKETNLLRKGAKGIEARPGLAADDQGNVLIIWHEGSFTKEDKRVIWARRSKNDGKSWDRGKPITPKGCGVCPCCNLDMALANDGKLYIIFRAAKKKVDRDMMLLTSTDFGKTFEAETFDTWKLERCPTQAGSIITGPDGKAGVLWKNKDEVKFAPIDSLAQPHPLPGGPGKRASSMAINKKGEMLVSWVSGRTTQKPGTLHWQVFKPDGGPTKRLGKEKMNTSTAPTAEALADGSFIVIY